jgi:predicted RNase H-like nuclease (RuvC/YqgF family)
MDSNLRDDFFQSIFEQLAQVHNNIHAQSKDSQQMLRVLEQMQQDLIHYSAGLSVDKTPENSLHKSVALYREIHIRDQKIAELKKELSGAEKYIGVLQERTRELAGRLKSYEVTQPVIVHAGCKV